VSPALIKKVLGFSVQPPQVTVSGNELTCRYEIPKLYQSVAVHFTSGMTRQSFEYFRDAYSKGTKTTTVKGLGQEAWASVVSLYGARAGTRALRKGHRCSQAVRQELEQGRHAQRPEFHFAHLLRDRDGPHVGRARGAVSGEGPADQN
jgi:hypothetical protein